MLVITQMGIYALAALTCITLAFLGGFHQWKLEERLRELKVHNDDQVKYFCGGASLFGCIAWIILAFIFCVLMVYCDWKALGL